METHQNDVAVRGPSHITVIWQPSCCARLAERSRREVSMLEMYRALNERTQNDNKSNRSEFAT